MDSLRDGKSELVNTNKLVRNYQGCTGLKTGSTSGAIFNLSASASLVSDTTVQKINIFTMTGNVIHNWFNLCR